MTPGESAASEASHLPAPQAPDLQAAAELGNLLDLWSLCGHRAEDLPPWPIFRRGLWAQAWIDAYEGRSPRLPAPHAMAAYADPPEEGCGVDPFV